MVNFGADGQVIEPHDAVPPGRIVLRDALGIGEDRVVVQPGERVGDLRVVPVDAGGEQGQDAVARRGGVAPERRRF